MSYLAEEEIRSVRGLHTCELRIDIDRQARERARKTEPIPGLRSLLLDRNVPDDKQHRWTACGDMFRSWDTADH